MRGNRLVEHSFIVPLYNEEENIRGTIETILASREVFSNGFEILVVDDFSSDNSLRVIKEIAAKEGNIRIIVNNQNLGFAKTFKRGLAVSVGEFVQYIPSDNVISKDCLKEMLNNRIKGELTLQYCLNERERAFSRYLISKGFTRYLNFIHGWDIKYFNGLHIYPGDFLRSLEIRESSFAFQAEILIASLKALRYRQVGANCLFKDESSSALSIGNIKGVSVFLLKQALLYVTLLFRRNS